MNSPIIWEFIKKRVLWAYHRKKWVFHYWEKMGVKTVVKSQQHSSTWNTKKSVKLNILNMVIIRLYLSTLLQKHTPIILKPKWPKSGYLIRKIQALTWKSLKRVLPLDATISKSISNCCPSVVSLYGAQRAKVRKSKSELITRAPVPWSWNEVTYCLRTEKFK